MTQTITAGSVTKGVTIPAHKGTSKLNLWTTARTTRAGDAVSEILAFEDGRVRARILTRSQILTVWLPMDAVTVERHFTWGPA